MFARKSGIVVFILALFGVVLSATGASMATSWHGLSQSQRNARILNVALDQVGDDTGMECKAWVQDVVDEASNGAVYPPRNQNDYTWRSSSDVYRMQQPFPIEWAEPGDIIQMRWANRNGSTTPHTAILVSKSSSRMRWVDCNWVEEDTVGTHYVTYADFYRAVGSNYNVYQIR